MALCSLCSYIMVLQYFPLHEHRAMFWCFRMRIGVLFALYGLCSYIRAMSYLHAITDTGAKKCKSLDLDALMATICHFLRGVALLCQVGLVYLASLALL